MPGRISCLGLIKLQFTFLSLLPLFPLFCFTILKELFAYRLLYERKENGLCFCSHKYTFMPPAWLSVIKERMWLNFPRLGFTSPVVYTVQKSFYTSKFVLFLIFFIYGEWSLLGPGGSAFDVSNALFLHIFVHEICLYETESNISHPVCVIFKPYPPRSFSSVRAYVWLYHAYSNTLFHCQ